MANVTLDDATLYYQWMINNNSTSTMLNALSGTDTSSDSFLSSVTGANSIGSLLGTSGLTGTGATDSISDFASILKSYMTQNNTTAATEAATMADKLSGVLEEAAKTEDTSSLTYKTVQEIYDYFKEQTSARANELLGNTTLTAASETNDSAASKSNSTGLDLDAIDYDEMDQMAIRGEEFDFDAVDSVVDNAFGESTPLSA